MNIEKKIISMNYNKGVIIKPKYIVIHETGNTKVGANALSHYNYWNTNSTAGTSAHFVVDDKQVIQLGEYENGKCFRMWHVGDNKGKSDISNDNSIGIEICVNSDGNYTKARKNAIELTKYILEKVGLPVTAVKRHYDSWGKHCPATMLNKPELWTDFINQLSPKPISNGSNPPSTTSPTPSNVITAETRNITPKVSGVTIAARGLFFDSTNYVPIRFLELLGYKVEWSAADKSTVLIPPAEQIRINASTVPFPTVTEKITAEKREIIIKVGGKTIPANGLFANGTNYVPIRYLEPLGFVVGWDSVDKSITLITPEEKEILYRITQAEAGGEDAKGRTLVANVIMNRVKSAGFPNSIKEVVFEPGQFEPTRNEAYEKAVVSDSTKAAVNDALAGTDYSQGALYFIANKAITPDSFHERKCVKLFVHGGHTFYL